MSQFATRLRRRERSRQKALHHLTVFLVFILPVYPAFGTYMQDYTGSIVRGDVDTSTILDAEDGETGEITFDLGEDETESEIIPETTTIVAENIPAPAEDPKRSLYPTHIVRRGDTVGGIAQKYGISVSSLQSTNDLGGTQIRIGQKLLIPRIKGVSYVVKKGDTLNALAEIYGVKKEAIILANDRTSDQPLAIDEKILIPNPTKDPTAKEKPKTPSKPVQKTPARPAANKSTQAVVRTSEKSPEKISYDGYTLDLKVEKGCRNFAWGNCTCFVAKYKNVTWRGNAKEWLKNAKKAGAETGDTPRPGAIIVYSGYGFPPAYGHVGIVMSVDGDTMIVKDMNYRALNEITTRSERVDHPAIIGYIYVD